MAAKTARAGAGVPAESCCNSCRNRPNGHARRTSIPAMRRLASSSYVPPEDDAWVEGRSLVETVDDIELIDPALSSERLAYRLFHEPGVRVFRTAPVHAQCSCSRQSVEAMLQSFPQEDRDDMVEDGKITVTCEFCSSTYVFEPAEITAEGSALS